MFTHPNSKALFSALASRSREALASPEGQALIQKALVIVKASEGQEAADYFEEQFRIFSSKVFPQ